MPEIALQSWVLPRFVLALLTLSISISGCQVETRRLSVENAAPMKKAMLVAVETPPLEVIPDLLETRRPVIRALETMEISAYSIPALYRYPGGILIYGQTVSDDSFDKLTANDPLLVRDNVQYSCAYDYENLWLPAHDLALQAAESLSTQRIKLTFNGLYRHLPLNSDQRKAHLSHWRDAVEQWYAEETSPVKYAALISEPVDAVIELAISDFRIFEGQVSVQVLMKMIDSQSGQVIAKTGQSDYVSRTSAEGLLLPDGSAFKKLIADMGLKLVKQEFETVGFFIHWQ